MIPSHLIEPKQRSSQDSAFDPQKPDQYRLFLVYGHMHMLKIKWWATISKLKAWITIAVLTFLLKKSLL